MSPQYQRAGFLKRLLLWLQRLHLPAPAMLRTPLRLLLARLTAYDAAKLAAEARRDELGGRGPDSEGPGSRDQAEGGVPRGAAAPTIRHEASGARPSDLRCLFAAWSVDVGGLAEVLAFLARRLRQHGIHTAVLDTRVVEGANGRPAGRIGRLLAADGIDTVTLDADEGARWIARWRPDVISAHNPSPWLLGVAAALSIPYVDTLHGVLLDDHDPVQEVERGRHLSRIVAVSDLVRRQYLALNPNFPPERLVTIPNAVDDAHRLPVDRGRARARWGFGTEYVFVSLGRLAVEKNSYALVAAFGDVAARHPEAHLVLAGNPWSKVYFSQVMALRDRLPCRDRIHVHDNVENPAEVLAMADGFVLDSFHEGWCLASMEALCAGVPVVLSEVAGAHEQVGTDETRGYLVANPLGDPMRVNRKRIQEALYVRQVNREALVRAMRTLIAQRRVRLAARAVLMAESAARFRPDECVRSHARVLFDAANRQYPVAGFTQTSLRGAADHEWHV